MQPKNSKRPQKPTKSSRTTNSDNSTIPTAMRVSIPTLVADRVAIHSRDLRALVVSREGMVHSTSRHRVRRLIPRNCSRPSSVLVVGTDDAIATVVHGRVPTCKCMSA